MGLDCAAMLKLSACDCISSMISYDGVETCHTACQSFWTCYHTSMPEKQPDGKICINPNVLILLAKPTDLVALRSIHLYLIFEKSNWMNWIFNLQKSIPKLIIAGYTGSKNPVRNRLKIQFVELNFSNLIFQKSCADG